MISIGQDIEINPNIELLTPQVHDNMAIIPLKTEPSYIDLLTLKKGLQLGLVKVSECDHSVVNTLVVKNRAVTPLILIDGDEVVGGDQNRIVNATMLIDAQTSMKIHVSCSERGRWGYKSEFKQSQYIANYNTRRAKAYASRKSDSYQEEIWSSIDALEHDNAFSSPTSAMEESYINLRKDHNKIVSEFKVVDGQNGVLIIVDGEIKGFELFLNSAIYKEFHEKILRSYLIDSKLNNQTFTVNVDHAREIINNALNSSFEKRETKGLEDAFEFENQDGLGSLYLYKNQIIHFSYFKKLDEIIEDELQGDAQLKTDI